MAKAAVTHVGLVLPLPPELPAVEFNLSFLIAMKGNLLVDCISGEGRHPSLLLDTQGKDASAGHYEYQPPSDTGNESRRLKGTVAEALGALRQEAAELQGKEASTSIVLVVTPVTHAGQAKARRQILRFVQGQITVGQVAEALTLNRDAEKLDSFLERGIITREQRDLIADAMTRVSIEGPSLASRGYDDFSPLRGADSYAFGGPMRGGSLHSGLGSVGDRRYSVSKERPEPDPFQSPKIYVAHLLCVPQGPEAFTPQEFAAELVLAIRQRDFEDSIL